MRGRHRRHPAAPTPAARPRSFRPPRSRTP